MANLLKDLESLGSGIRVTAMGTNWDKSSIVLAGPVLKYPLSVYPSLGRCFELDLFKYHSVITLDFDFQDPSPFSEFLTTSLGSYRYFLEKLSIGSSLIQVQTQGTVYMYSVAGSHHLPFAIIVQYCLIVYHILEHVATDAPDSLFLIYRVGFN